MPKFFAPTCPVRSWLLWPGLPLALILAFRLWALQAGGALSFPDEERHLKSIEAVRALLAGNPEQASLHLANTQGRPADALLRLPVAAAQVALERTGQLPVTSPDSLLLPQLMNWLVLLLNMVLLWRLARRWLPTSGAATVLLVYSALGSTNLYVRHLLPYDTALGVTLLALVLLSGPGALQRGPGHNGLWAGALGLLAFGIYPGYYMAPLLPATLLALTTSRGQWRNAAVGLGAGAVGVILPLELLTRYGHISYLRTLQHLSATVTQGEFAESFSFVPRYLWEVEGASGILLLLGLLPGVVALLTRHAAPVARVVALIPVAAWLLHASLGYFAHHLVFYGRLVHFFLPFLALYTGTALHLLRPRWLYLTATAVVGSVALIGLLRFAPAYLALAYPRDVLAAHPATSTAPLRYLNEGGLNATLNYRVPPRQPATSTTAPSDALVLLNCTFLYPLLRAGCHPISPPAGYRLTFDGPHFLTLPAYGFEGFTPPMRTRLRQCRFRCRVYEKGIQ
ncbi:hypothetical protein K3G63_01000 [Hymenobacter sp. HSC-4F20]|uniref:hypothetical protein n=1 Tax=Hymenobacter sp. HSC-4F20 TaxID=2864135 RepID=UPI001C73C7D0|nr:hypothetical protein [Hymenobacter sp. HSC-4F20]MBX0288993.1 hypothetical protein [Hymenobacter sp. HSC-4F20]